MDAGVRVAVTSAEVENGQRGIAQSSLQVVCIADGLDVSVEHGENRRAHERLRASELQWLRGARIKYGADVRVLDISAGGMRREVHIARPAAAPSVGWQKVIARFIDGLIVAGYTNDFHPTKQQLHLFPNPRQGESTFIPLARLKALFFVREFSGDPTLIESKDFVEPPQGRKVEVTFHDNEVIVGSTLGYRGDGNGFFLHPADGRSNNLRVFVTAAGLRRMRFL